MTIRVYYLDTRIIDGVQHVDGEQYIDRALLEVEGTQRKLIMDTSSEQHDSLKNLATSHRLAYPQEEAALRNCIFLDTTPGLESQVAELRSKVAAVEAKVSALEAARLV